MRFKQGLYRHFKGNYYTLLFTAYDSETLEEKVVYRAEYGERKIWVRPASMWDESIVLDSGEKVSRFTYVGGELPSDKK